MGGRGTVYLLSTATVLDVAVTVYKWNFIPKVVCKCKEMIFPRVKYIFNLCNLLKVVQDFWGHDFKKHNCY